MEPLQVAQAGDMEKATEHARSPRFEARIIIAMGALHAVLFLLAYWLMSGVPGAKATAAEIQKFYSSGDSLRPIIAGLYLMPFAGIAFIWFIVALQRWVAKHVRWESVLLSNVQLVSGILYVGMFFATAAAISAAAAGVEFSGAQIDPFTVRQFPEFGFELFFVFAMRMAAIVVFTTSSIGHKSGILPRWFAYVGYAVGLFLLLSATFNQLLVLVFPVWLLALCGVLLALAHRLPAPASASSGVAQSAPSPGGSQPVAPAPPSTSATPSTHTAAAGTITEGAPDGLA